MKHFFKTLFATCLLISSTAFAGTPPTPGCTIKITSKGLKEGSTCLLACYYGDKNYIKDSAKANAKGEVVFTATEKYKNRVIELKGDKKNVHNVGALSIDNLKSLKLYSKKEFKNIFSIDISLPTILITFQPETTNFQLNKQYIKTLMFEFWY